MVIEGKVNFPMTKEGGLDRRSILRAASAVAGLTFTPLGAAYGKSRHIPIGYIRTNWSRDPFAYGSYSFFARGSGRSDTRALSEPIGQRVFFAGEAAHPEYNSTVHAAHESGLIAAGQLLQTDHQTIAIIGAGMAGLTAAHRLSNAGRSVSLFEARDRLGGRIWTNRDLGVPLDCGASWIHGVDDNPLTDLADQVGQDRVVTNHENSIARGNDGRRIPGWRLPRWISGAGETQISVGADPDQIDGRAYWDIDDYDGDEVVFPQGYDAMLAALDGAYEVRLSSPVSHLDYSANTVLLTEADVQHSFDAVMVTVPLGVLKSGDLQFSPPLPPEKQGAIDRLGMGLLDRLYLKFDTVFWDEDPIWIVTPETGRPRGQYTYFLNLYALFGMPILLLFHGATPARQLSSLSDDEMVSNAMQVLNAAYPDA